MWAASEEIPPLGLPGVPVGTGRTNGRVPGSRLASAGSVSGAVSFRGAPEHVVPVGTPPRSELTLISPKGV